MTEEQLRELLEALQKQANRPPSITHVAISETIGFTKDVAKSAYRRSKTILGAITASVKDVI